MSDAPFEKPGLNLLGDKEVAQGLIAESNRRLFQARTLAGIAGVPLFGNRRELPDGSVITTAVFGGQSRVNITGAPPVEKKPVEPEEDLPSGYLLWPTSDQNPDGVLIRDDVPVSPTVLLTLDGTSADVELDMPIEAARDDWLSDDGDGEYGKNLLTYQTDSKFRYQFAGYDNSGRGQPVIFVNGVGAYTQHGVRGACMRGDDTVIYASISGDHKTLTLHHFAPPEEAGNPDETTFGTYTSALTITQPVFFDGKGTKFVTVAREALPDSHGDPIYHRVRGAITVVSGELVLTVTTVPLGMEPRISESWDAVVPVQVNDGYGGYLFTISYHDTVRHAWDELLGLDMSITGEELLVVRRNDFSSSRDIETVRVQRGDAGGGRYPEYHRSNSSDITLSSLPQSVCINGEPIYSVTGKSEFRLEDDYGLDIPGPGVMGTYFGTSTHFESYDTVSLRLREIDARFGAIVALTISNGRVDHRYQRVYYSYDWIPLEYSFSNIEGKLTFLFESETWEKQVLDWEVGGEPNNTLSGYLAGDRRPYRLFASRQKGDLVASVALMSGRKGSANYPDPLAAACDMTPITVVRNKRADFTLSNEDLGLGESDTGVTFYSVRMT